MFYVLQFGSEGNRRSPVGSPERRPEFRIIISRKTLKITNVMCYVQTINVRVRKYKSGQKMFTFHLQRDKRANLFDFRTMEKQYQEFRCNFSKSDVRVG